MKNIIKLFGIIALLAVTGFSMVEAAEAGGTFTLTGIPSQYNGKYAWLTGASKEDPTTGLSFWGCQDINARTGVLISNGKVSIPVWYFELAKPTAYKRYSGNDTCYVIHVIICNSQNGIKNSETPLAQVLFSNDLSTKVTFSNGSAAKSWNNGYVVITP